MRTNSFSSRSVLAAKLGAALVVAALALTGCSSGPGERSETTLTKSADGATLTVTYVAEGDDVVEQTTENIVVYAESGIANRAAAEEQVGELVEQYKGIRGVDHAIEFGETELVETVTMNYTDLDVEAFAKATGAGAEEDPAAVTKVSLKEAVASLTGAGFTEVE